MFHVVCIPAMYRDSFGYLILTFGEWAGNDIKTRADYGTDWVLVRRPVLNDMLDMMCDVSI